jgi:hypothetical protein
VEEGFADLDRSTPGCSPQQAKGVLAEGPNAPLAPNDNLRRGEFPPRQANSRLVENPDFAPRSLFESPDCQNCGIENRKSDRSVQ